MEVDRSNMMSGVLEAARSYQTVRLPIRKNDRSHSRRFELTSKDDIGQNGVVIVLWRIYRLPWRWRGSVVI